MRFDECIGLLDGFIYYGAFHQSDLTKLQRRRKWQFQLPPEPDI
jgi:hypothetical protein